jgi:hypothetical protein
MSGIIGVTTSTEAKAAGSVVKAPPSECLQRRIFVNGFPPFSSFIASEIASLRNANHILRHLFAELDEKRFARQRFHGVISLPIVFEHLAHFNKNTPKSATETYMFADSGFNSW